MTSPAPPIVSPERVVAILQQSELGAALWRAATYEALAEAYQDRVQQLEAQQGTSNA